MAPVTNTATTTTEDGRAKTGGTKRVAEKKAEGKPAPKRSKVSHPFCNAMLLRYPLLRR
jgi:hypothetical protein